MTVPSRSAATRVLLDLRPPSWHLRHSRAVAEVAGWLALRIARQPGGLLVDRPLVETAALLHDVDKVMPRALRGGLPHGEAGAAWLTARGFPELGEVVALHPVTRLMDAEGAREVLGASVEARIVSYADKRARQRVVPMAHRFGAWARGHRARRSDEAVDRVWRAARELEDDVCRMAGCRPEDVGRLRWTGPVLRRARSVPTVPPAR